MTTRLLLAATAIVACVTVFLVASVAAAPRTSTSNRRAARRDAELLLSRLQLPAGAVSTATEPSGDGGYLNSPPPLFGSSARVNVHAWWRVPGAPTAAVEYVKGHRPAGSTLSGYGEVSVGGQRINQLNFMWPAVRGVLRSRTLMVSVMALRDGETGILAEAQSDWIVTRPRAEKVPSTVHEVDVATAAVDGSPTIELSVTTAAKVRRLVSLINTLPIVQPAVYSCPALLTQGARVITLRFQSAVGGRLLAQASYVAYRDLAYDSGPCNAVDLTIAGRRQKPLLGGNFLWRVQRLLGVHLVG